MAASRRRSCPGRCGCSWRRGRRSLPTERRDSCSPPPDVPRLPRVVRVRTRGLEGLRCTTACRLAANLPRNQTRLVDSAPRHSRAGRRGRSHSATTDLTARSTRDVCYSNRCDHVGRNSHSHRLSIKMTFQPKPSQFIRRFKPMYIGLLIKPSLANVELYAVMLPICLSVRSSVSLSPMKFVKAFARWQHRELIVLSPIHSSLLYKPLAKVMGKGEIRSPTTPK